MKASYFLASFLTSFLFLLSFLRASVSMHGRLLALASSQCCWSPKTHTWNFGRGMCFSLQGGKRVRSDCCLNTYQLVFYPLQKKTIDTDKERSLQTPGSTVLRLHMHTSGSHDVKASSKVAEACCRWGQRNSAF
uniref:Putative secreted protein n=1 Tax=Ixodes ricinus TaxID=34613 RepID=A0A6B0URS7_IXORI